LVSPTTLVPAPLIAQQWVDIDGKKVTTREALVSCNSPFSMIGLPAASVPSGELKGLPVGIQVIGPRFEDLLTLDMAELIHQVSLS
jgi:aspartyl-tRNA(Asn)/glutamyl-tRNA(Gln) amidotransferase subunit A